MHTNDYSLEELQNNYSFLLAEISHLSNKIAILTEKMEEVEAQIKQLRNI